MPDSSPSQVCPRCGRAASPGRGGGFCPRCLLKEALGSRSLAEVLKGSAPDGSLPRAFGGYELIEEVARGGMGIVYRARQLPVNRVVAVKVLAAGWHAAPDFIERFRVEAEAVASLDHPNIVPTYEVGECEGQPFFSMRFIDGGSLARNIALASAPAPERTAVALMAKLSRAVHYAHQRGILHRDIKPGNVLLDGQGEPYLTDFGLARLVERDSTLTRTVAMLGTPSYMSPEQARGEVRQLTTAVDVYGLGAVFYELLTGQPPFAAGTTVATVRQVLDQEPRRPSQLRPGLDSDLETICLKCLEKDPARRYGSAEAFGADLDRWQRHEPILARPPSLTYQLRKSWSRNRLAWLAGLAVVLALVTGLGVAASAWRQSLRSEAVADGQRKLAEDRLYLSLTREARDLRSIRAVGYRREVAACLHQALAIDSPHRNPEALRWEYAQCFGDALGLEPIRPTNAPPGYSDAALDASGKLAAFASMAGRLDFIPLRGGVPFTLHAQGSVTQLAFHPSGRTLFGVLHPVSAAAGESNGVVAWRVTESGSWSRGPVVPLPGVRHLIPASRGVTAVVLDQAAREVRLLPLPDGPVAGSIPIPAGEALPEIVEASDDGRFIAREAAAGPDQPGTFVEVWDAVQRRRLARIDPGMGPVRHLTFSPGGQFLACTMDNGVTAYETAGFRAVALCREFGTPRARWGGDGTVLVVPLAQTAGLLLYQVKQGSVGLCVPQAHEVMDIRVSLDGTTLMVADHRFRLQVITLVDDSERRRFSGHDGGVPVVEFSPDGTRIASAGKDGTIRLWDATSGAPLRAWDAGRGEGQSVAFSPDGRWLATGYYQNNWIDVWSVTDGAKALTLGDDSSNGGQTWSCEFSPDGRCLVAAGHGLRAWELNASGTGAASSLAARRLFHEPGHVRSPRFHPSGRWFAFQGTLSGVAGSRSGIFSRGLDPEGPAEFLHRGQFAVQTLDLLPDVDELVCWSTDDHLHFIRRADRTEVRKFSKLARGEAASSHVGNLRVSPDGTRIAVAGPSGRGVNLHDVATGRRLLSLPEDPGSVWWLAWHPGGRQLAVSRGDGDISVWNLDVLQAELARVGLGP